jgi:hypothetical protein
MQKGENHVQVAAHSGVGETMQDRSFISTAAGRHRSSPAQLSELIPRGGWPVSQHECCETEPRQQTILATSVAQIDTRLEHAVDTSWHCRAFKVPFRCGTAITFAITS